MLVKDIMTTKVISVLRETSISRAFDFMLKGEFSGLPVINSREENKLVGIITEYDFISKRSSIHLPTFDKLFSDFYILDRHSPVYKELENVGLFKAKDIMNQEPITIREDAAVEDVVRLFTEHHRVNPIPVVTDGNILVGIVSRYDIVNIFAKSIPKSAK